MLRESSKATNPTLDLSGVADITVNTGVEQATEIIALTDAVVLADSDELEIARTALTEHLGVAGTVRTIAVAANFMMMNTIMDALGTAPRPKYSRLAEEVGLDQAHN